ncbi:chemotaxis protein [Vibrio zhanjiangensis]|uniref:Chemotaxis protein n=1 Tax=Vibrio zhanjiangensis TaxID=1046128 RepID=A0ABQ6EW38_9VIBR|nr:YggN family protein [Vibrio zhanjiangensis]GLT17219.1 chemotaxis protein [Vibrio zhanjiangensis]
MKQVLLTIPLLMMVSQLNAAQCKVDLKNDIRLNGERLEIHQQDGNTAVVDSQNRLMIEGKEVTLEPEQQKAISDYRTHLNDYLPRAKQMARDGLALANEIIDDVGESFDAPEAFDNVKASMQAFYDDIEQRYYKDGDLILPADSFSSLSETWSQDFESAKKLFNEEFISSAFSAMSEKMKAEEGLNLTKMAETMSELKERIANRLKQHAGKVEQQSQEFCDSLDDLAEEEQELHQIIPQLQDYQMFTI